MTPATKKRDLQGSSLSVPSKALLSLLRACAEKTQHSLISLKSHQLTQGLWICFPDSIVWSYNIIISLCLYTGKNIRVCLGVTRGIKWLQPKEAHEIVATVEGKFFITATLSFIIIFVLFF